MGVSPLSRGNQSPEAVYSARREDRNRRALPGGVWGSECQVVFRPSRIATIYGRKCDSQGSGSFRETEVLSVMHGNPAARHL